MPDLEAELLKWAGKQQPWQSDALRRLAQGNALSAEDVRELASEAERCELSKAAPWSTEPELDEALATKPLEATHLQVTESSSPAVSLHKIHHLEGANDLAPGATVEFALEGLTIVAGRNGSGKSGYTRILKQVAASRGPEKVLPNAFKEGLTPKATITYQVGGDGPAELQWDASAATSASPLQRARVFDARSAAAQLSASSEVAYVPPVLQILADYTTTLRSIGEVIDDDLQRLKLTQRSWPDLEAGVGLEIFENIGDKSGLSAIAKHAKLSKAETEELSEIPEKLRDLTVSDPARLATQARSRSAQLSNLARNLKSIAEGLACDHVEATTKLRDRVADAEKAVAEASSALQKGRVLQGVGSARWRAMWEAARHYIEDSSEHDFPDSSPDAVCALCQQPLDDAARERFSEFAEFMKGEAQSELSTAVSLRKTSVEAQNALPIDASVTQDLVDLVSTYDKETSDLLLPLIARAGALRVWLVEDEPATAMPDGALDLAAELIGVSKKLSKLAVTETQAAEKFGAADSNALAASRLQARGDELKLRAALAKNREAISAQHDLAIRVARLEAAHKTCDTTAASKQNTTLSKEYVDKVCESFAREAKGLGLERVPVELTFDKSSRGVSYIKLCLTGIPDVPVQTVLSEGEQRVAAIAGFFADLTESGDTSTLVFDDPVSSLDQGYREAVAQRLLQEAEHRQVLVFSHDFTFVQYIYEQRTRLERQVAASGETSPIPSIDYVHIARSTRGAGETTTSEHWQVPSVGERIKRLNQRIQDAGVLYRANDPTYELQARDIVGAIRDTWESFVEQDLLDGIVKRYERAVQTQRLKRITDVTDTDVSAVEDGMAITSRWRHDAPISDGTHVINPDGMAAELKKLKDFRASVIERRKGK